ncbi:MAG: HD-GYP domain-containing protein [Clostridia bacterium]|nr:HD-GYP domain-containing protein [Clostridia bacterium]
MLIIGQARLPVSALTGVLSAVANICLICLVVFYGKTGFIVTMCILAVQLPLLIRNVVSQQSLASIPGIFTSLLTIVAVILIRSRDRQIVKYRSDEVNRLKEQQQISQRLFEQTATALVTAIDAKDEYSHGHSMRVAEYARKIAQMMGKSEDECLKIYYAGLLHDVGKIGISDAIINKKGKLTPEEYDEIKKHPVLGNQILTSIRDYPYISIGAHYHHERYDGKGYPDGLKGEDIPEIARIISVADAYDAMSSNRSYRRAIPQQIIREEIVAGAGTQFDPEMAMIMRHLIDLDGEYRMKEREAVRELAGDNEMHCGEYRSDISSGIIVLPEITRIHLAYRDEEPKDEQTAPAIILFDSLDARVHDEEDTIRTLNYYEYCEIWLDGKTVNHGVRAIETTTERLSQPVPETPGRAVYDLEAVKCRDHVMIRIDDGENTTEVIVALPDSSRYVYIGLTGKDCFISDVHIEKEAEPAAADYIRRIAEEISYIDVPAGDIPNVQVDGIRSASSEGIPVKNGMKLTFHTMSLPTARLIWHCPYIVLFHSEDGQVDGKNYREYAVIRLDGENWEDNGKAQCRITATQEEDFEGWDAWKKGNKAGFDCAVTFGREGNRITVSTTNLGLSLEGVLSLPGKDNSTVYAALTGDQCAITNIRVGKQS